MKILSIETSCDETAVSYVEASGDSVDAEFTILGDSLYSQASKHAKYGGVYPTLAKREHAVNLVPLLEKTLKEAEVYENSKESLTKAQKDFLKKLLHREEVLERAIVRFFENVKRPTVDAISVTQGPGLEPALWVGINFAKALSYVWNIPILPVNHLEGHIIASSVESPEDNKYAMRDTTFPILALVISGGHTELVFGEKWGEYTIVGSTRDDSVGEAFDKVARMLDLPYPGGSELSKLADFGRKLLITRPAHLTKDAPQFPRPMIHSGDLDFSFSGLKTAVLYHVKEKGELNDTQKKLIASEFENAVSDVVIEKINLALKQYPAKTLILGGGVSANSHIRTRLEKTYADNSCTLQLPAQGLSTDNSVMIAMAGYFMHLRGAETVSGEDDLTALGNMKLDTKN